MGSFFEQYGRIVVYAVVGLLLISLLSGFVFTQWKSHGGFHDTKHLSSNEEMINASPFPSISGTKTGEKTKVVKKKVGEVYDCLDGIGASDSKDGTITNQIQVSYECCKSDGTITKGDVAVAGGKANLTISSKARYYNILYQVKNSRGYKAKARIKILVLPD